MDGWINSSTPKHATSEFDSALQCTKRGKCKLSSGSFSLNSLQSRQIAICYAHICNLLCSHLQLRLKLTDLCPPYNTILEKRRNGTKLKSRWRLMSPSRFNPSKLPIICRGVQGVCVIGLAAAGACNLHGGAIGTQPAEVNLKPAEIAQDGPQITGFTGSHGL